MTLTVSLLIALVTVSIIGWNAVCAGAQPTLAATDTAANPNTVAITRTELEDAARSFVYHFPAHSVTLIELHQRTSAG